MPVVGAYIPAVPVRLHRSATCNQINIELGKRQCKSIAICAHTVYNNILICFVYIFVYIDRPVVDFAAVIDMFDQETKMLLKK